MQFVCDLLKTVSPFTRIELKLERPSSILHIVADDNESSRVLLQYHRIFNIITVKATWLHHYLKIPVKPLFSHILLLTESERKRWLCSIFGPPYSVCLIGKWNRLHDLYCTLLIFTFYSLILFFLFGRWRTLALRSEWKVARGRFAARQNIWLQKLFWAKYEFHWSILLRFIERKSPPNVQLFSNVAASA